MEMQNGHAFIYHFNTLYNFFFFTIPVLCNCNCNQLMCIKCIQLLEYHLKIEKNIYHYYFILTLSMYRLAINLSKLLEGQYYCK